MSPIQTCKKVMPGNFGKVGLDFLILALHENNIFYTSRMEKL